MNRRIGNLALDATVQYLRQASRETGAAIWKDAVKYLTRHRSNRVSVNVGKIGRLTKKGDVVLVPGKVLGGGTLRHSLTVGGYSFSSSAVKKISDAGGRALPLTKFVKDHKDGREVLLIGG